MTDLAVDADIIVTMDDGRSVLRDGRIIVASDRIVAVGPRSELEQSFPDVARRVGGPGFMAMPAFMDGHSHAGHGLVRSLGGDDFPVWRQACRTIYLHSAPPEFWEAEARLSALERIKAGVGTTVAYLGGGDENSRTDTVEIAQAYAKAFIEAGGDLLLGVGPTRPPHPAHVTQYEAGAAQSVAVSLATQLANCAALLDTLPSDRVRVALTTPVVNPAIHAGPHFEDLCALAQRMKAMARDAGVMLMIDGHCRGTVAFAAERLGILDAGTLVCHAIDIDAAEIETLARTGATVAHNPLSCSAIWGRCPVPELLAAGAGVIVCSDGLAPDAGADMFRVMRVAMHYQRSQLRDPHVLPPGRVLAMATRCPAAAFGLADRGPIEPGKRADIQLIDMRSPHLSPPTMPLYQVMYAASAGDVACLVVAGRVVMEDRKVAGVDEAAVIAEAAAQAAAMLERAGLAHLADTPPSFWADRYDRLPYAGPHSRHRPDNDGDGRTPAEPPIDR